MRRALLILAACLGPWALQAQPGVRHAAVFQTDYRGRHPDLFAQHQDRVRLLIRQAQLETSSQLGLLQYQEGFECPLTVRFDDAAAPGVEHALAYVRLKSTPEGLEQEMVVNLDVMSRYSGAEFDRVFYHEMVHAVLNDAAAARAGVPLPSWVQEGLAVFISGDGEQRVRRTAQQVRRSQAHQLVRSLEEPLLDYSRNFLAIKYLHDKHSINSLQGFVRNLATGRTAEEAIEESTGLTWNRFVEQVKAYSAAAYQENARPDF